MTDRSVVPGESMGGVRLGWTQAEVIAFRGRPTEVRQNEDSVTIFYEDLEVDLRDDSVFEIITRSSSFKVPSSGAGVGTPWRALERLLPDIEYDEEEALWYSPSEPGVWYRVVAPKRGRRRQGDSEVEWEMYDVADPEKAYVDTIFVMRQ